MTVFGFSLVFIQFDIDGATIGSWSRYLMVVYGLTYSDFNADAVELQGGQLVFIVILTILLSLILFNMLVAIMGESFEKVQENAVVSESKERIVLIKQALAVKRLVEKTCCSRRKRKREQMSNEEKRSFLFVAEEAGVDEDADKENKEWEGRLQIIKKGIKTNEENMKIALSSFEVKLQKDLDDLKGDANGLETNIRKLEGRIARVETILNRNADPSDAASSFMYTEA